MQFPPHKLCSLFCFAILFKTPSRGKQEIKIVVDILEVLSLLTSDLIQDDRSFSQQTRRSLNASAGAKERGRLKCNSRIYSSKL